MQMTTWNQRCSVKLFSSQYRYRVSAWSIIAHRVYVFQCTSMEGVYYWNCVWPSISPRVWCCLFVWLWSYSLSKIITLFSEIIHTIICHYSASLLWSNFVEISITLGSSISFCCTRYNLPLQLENELCWCISGDYGTDKTNVQVLNGTVVQLKCLYCTIVGMELFLLISPTKHLLNRNQKNSFISRPYDILNTGLTLLCHWKSAHSR